ncbi:MAG: NAD(P)H-binding protein, partial [Bifidobacterium psychraerophilum]
MTANNIVTVLVIGASGSIGRLAVKTALDAGYQTTALVRDPTQSRLFPAGTRIVIGNLTDAETLRKAVAGKDAIIFTHGTYGGADEAEAVNYGAVRNVLSVL